MKKTLLFIVTCLVSLSEAHAQAAKLDAMQVGRYTRQGADVLVESGFLVASTKKFESSGASLYPEESLGLPASSITAISGKFTALKATIDVQMGIKGFLDNYRFSEEAYPVVAGDAYIVTLASDDDLSAPSASLKVTKTKLTEGSKAKSKIKITLDKATKSDIVIRYKLSGTAKENSDYRVTGSEGLVKIKKGKKSGSVSIIVNDDRAREKTEKMKIKLLAGSEYKLGKRKKATVRISDNDK